MKLYFSVGYLIIFNLHFSILAQDFIQIKELNGRALFYSKNKGYFWSLGINNFMDAGKHNELQKFFKKNYNKELYEQQLSVIMDHGFNTLGGWSNLEYNNNQLPFGVILFNDDKMPLSWPLKDKNGKIPPIRDSNKFCPINDPYNPEYILSVEKYIKESVAQYTNNPMLLVYWPGAEFGLGGSDTIDFSEYLHSKYVKKRFKDWLQVKYKKKIFLEKSSKNDRLDFSVLMIKDWLKLIVNSIKKYDPNHLISTPKFSVWDTDPFLDDAEKLRHFESFQGLFDIISVDWYSKKNIHSKKGYKQLNKLQKYLKIPILVAEFGTREKIKDWTNTQGVRSLVANQKERAQYYISQLSEIFSNKNFIGAHWFRWHDYYTESHQQNKGIIFLKNEKINIYPELMEAMKKENSRVNSSILKINP